jgi:hypothetical protein
MWRFIIVILILGVENLLEVRTKVCGDSSLSSSSLVWRLSWRLELRYVGVIIGVLILGVEALLEVRTKCANTRLSFLISPG